MADRRFFTPSGSLALSEIASLTGAALAVAGGGAPDGARRFAGVAPLDRAGAEEVSFLDNVKYLEMFAASRAGACFVRPKYAGRAPAGMALLVTEEPYCAYALAAQRFYPEPEQEPGVAPSAIVAGSARLGSGVRLDPGCVIGERAVIGEGCRIGAYTVIGDGVEIGAHCRIGAHCTLTHAVLGKGVILHRGVHIGQDGFGFAPSKRGIVKVPQLGRVLIGDDVEIGSGTCIDRGAGPDTLIGDGCKIDNLVQIGHNARLGKNVILVAQCGIAGSTSVGDGVMVGGQAGIAGHVRIGDGAKVAAQAGVMTDIPPGAAYGGCPAVPVKDWHRQTVTAAKWVQKKEGDE